MYRPANLVAAVFFLVITAGLAYPLRAQKSYALGFGGGAAIPVGRLSDTQKTGFNGIVSLALGSADVPIGLRIDGIYNRFPRNGVVSPQSGATTTAGFRVTGVLANLIYAFPGTTEKTYVVIGGGLYSTKTEIAGAKAKSDLGLNAGAGFTFAIGPIASFVESRYHFIRRAPADGGLIHFVPITVGLMF
jgi:hypothetical protein